MQRHNRPKTKPPRTPNRMKLMLTRTGQVIPKPRVRKRKKR